MSGCWTVHATGSLGKLPLVEGITQVRSCNNTSDDAQNPLPLRLPVSLSVCGALPCIYTQPYQALPYLFFGPYAPVPVLTPDRSDVSI